MEPISRTTNPIASPSAKNSKSAESPKKAKASTDPDFSDQLAGAEVEVANLLAGQNAPAIKPADPVAGPMGGKALADAQAQAQAQAQALQGKAVVNALKSSAERSPVTQKTAISSNTASVIAGPKPWSTDWVLDGGIEANANVRPLFGEASQPSADPRASAAAAAAQKILRLNKGGETEGKGVNPLTEALLSGTEFENLLETPSPEMAEHSGGTEAVETKSLAHNLGALNGSVVATGDSASIHAQGAGALSGSEFVTTLNAVQGGSVGGVGAESRQHQSNLSGNGGGGEGWQQQSQQQPGQAGNLNGPGFRVIDGGIRKKPAFSEVSPLETNAAASAMQRGPTVGPALVATTQISGHVTQGSMTRDRLSSESLIGISSGIRNLSASGGGEIHVRLNPGNLGELHLKVTTDGKQVGLKIQASDEGARKILEQSLSDLSTSLAKHQLTLKAVDVTVAQLGGGAASDQSFGSSSQQHQQGGSSAYNGFNDLMNGRDQHGRGNGFQNGSGGYGNEGYGLSSDSGAQRRGNNYVASSSAARATIPRGPSSTDGRLDVMA